MQGLKQGGNQVKFEIVTNERNINNHPDVTFLGKETAKRALHFHESFPMYEKTPMRQLEQLADFLGVKDIYVKDESYRFGLNAFKVLGGSYAIGNYIAKKLGTSIEALSFDKIVSKETKDKIGKTTFISATDGNHGRGVAWTASQLGQEAVIYMPKGSALERLNNI
ncbi:MAG: pyridoxal-phosphate dependent enzyme, partial [Clostridiales bacterium]|nr:pyridoxal-phosphate dependent enzyme [Clostridiales bacterium]